jgi:hypothetical protein
MWKKYGNKIILHTFLSHTFIKGKVAMFQVLYQISELDQWPSAREMVVIPLFLNIKTNSCDKDRYKAQKF